MITTEISYCGPIEIDTDGAMIIFDVDYRATLKEWHGNYNTPSYDVVESSALSYKGFIITDDEEQQNLSSEQLENFRSIVLSKCEELAIQESVTT